METSALYRETLPVIASSVVAWLGVGFLMLERYKMLSLRRRVVATPVDSSAAILNALPDMIFLVDEDGTYLDCYTKGVRTNYPGRDQFLGKNMRDLMPPELFEVFATKLKRVLTTEEHATVEYKLTTEGKPQVFEARIVKCGDRRLLCIVRDLTEIKRTEEELQLVSSRLLTLQDEERRKIARELHDVTAQNLFAITINLANLRQQIKHFTDAQLSIVVECENLCEQSLRDVRTLSYALHPPALDRLGLTPSVRWYIDTLNRRSGTNITLQAPNNLDRLPLQLETDIFRVIQEGLGNVARHSSSCTATVDLQQQSDQFVLCITENCRCCLTDNGSGSHNDGGVGVGLSSMQERLRRWGGHLHIQSGSDGVLLLANVPIPASERWT